MTTHLECRMGILIVGSGALKVMNESEGKVSITLLTTVDILI